MLDGLPVSPGLQQAIAARKGECAIEDATDQLRDSHGARMQRESELVQSRIHDLHVQELTILDDFNAFEQKQTETLEHQLAYMLGEVTEFAEPMAPPSHAEMQARPLLQADAVPGVSAADMLATHQKVVEAGRKFIEPLLDNDRTFDEEEALNMQQQQLKQHQQEQLVQQKLQQQQLLQQQSVLDRRRNSGVNEKEPSVTIQGQQRAAPVVEQAALAGERSRRFQPGELPGNVDTPRETFKLMVRFAMGQLGAAARGEFDRRTKSV